MRFPHRVRISDPRNRQPPEGVAYDAKAYDVVLLSRPSFEITDITVLKINHTEPSNVKAVFYDLPALVTASDEGTRNLADSLYTVRIPHKAFIDARTYLEEQRLVSLNKFNYETNAALLTQVVQYSPEGFLFPFNNVINSSYLEDRLRLNILSVNPVPDAPNPFTDRIVPGGLLWTYNENTNDFNGVFPPIKDWHKSLTPEERSLTASFTQLENINRVSTAGNYAELVGNYPIGLQIRKINAYADIVEIRCVETLSYL